MSSLPSWLRTPRIRRGLAVSCVALAAGGLVLYRSHGDTAIPGVALAAPLPNAAGVNATAFAGPGAHGTFSLSHTKVLAAGEQRVFAELRMVADAVEPAKEHAPLSLVVVLDTSGSMGGEKIQQAKNAIVSLIGNMKDDDQIALVRYSSDAQLLQPMTRVGRDRSQLINQVHSLRADGGTNIPLGLRTGLQALASSAGKGRVRRVVLVSDGLDSSRTETESLARNSFEGGVVISSLGIGLDFDEAYMGGVAQAGHGNFAFVNDGPSLTSFLRRELDETASTTIENATARVELPRGVRFVRAMGADAVQHGDAIDLKMGSLFSGDERRVVVELAASLDSGDTRGITGAVTWSPVGSGTTGAQLARLDLVGTTDANAVHAGLDGTVFGSSTSALAAARQLEATEAYAHGDVVRAQTITQQNLNELHAAATAAPAPMKAELAAQLQDYDSMKGGFGSNAPSSPAGRAMAKSAVQRDMANVARPMASAYSAPPATTK